MRPLLLALALVGASAHAQPTARPPSEPATVDAALTRGLYAVDGPVAQRAFHAIDRAAYPVFLAAVPATALGTWALDGDLDVALRMGVAEVGVAAATLLLKEVVGRPRPYVTLGEVDARDPRHRGERVLDPNSFPSGHTSLAFALATSLSLSHPEWYVAGPVLGWAAATGASRVWLGVHYPSDVLAGAALGAGGALAVHLLLPDVFDGDDGAEAVPLRLVIPL